MAIKHQSSPKLLLKFFLTLISGLAIVVIINLIILWPLTENRSQLNDLPKVTQTIKIPDEGLIEEEPTIQAPSVEFTGDSKQ